MLSFFKSRKPRKPKSEEPQGVFSNILTLRNHEIDINESFTSQARHGYELNPYVYRAVNYIAESCASVHPLLFNSDDEIIENHPILDMLKYPNPVTSRFRLIEEIATHLRINGNAYIQKTMVNGKPRELYVLSPEHMSFVEGRRLDEPIRDYIYAGLDGVRWIPPSEIIHIKLINPRSIITGLSPMIPGSQSIQQNQDGRTWNTKLLQNGARTTGVIKNVHRLSDDEYETFKERFSETYRKSGELGRPMLLEEGLDWVPMGMNQVEMDFIQSHTLSAKEIAIAQGVPPEKIGDSANKTYSNAMEANKSFATDTQLPMLERIYGAFTMGLCGHWEDASYLTYDKDDIDALNIHNTELWSRVLHAGQSGVLTINEQREMLGFGDIGADGDIIFRSFGTVPLSEATQPLPDINWSPRYEETPDSEDE